MISRNHTHVQCMVRSAILVEILATHTLLGMAPHRERLLSDPRISVAQLSGDMENCLARCRTKDLLGELQYLRKVLTWENSAVTLIDVLVQYKWLIST